jgi:hypothetical protein
MQLPQITQKVPQQQTGKERNQGTTENCHIGHFGKYLCKSTKDLTLQIALCAQ